MVVRICAVALNLEYGHTDLRQVPPRNIVSFRIEPVEAWRTVVLNRWKSICPSCFDGEAERAGDRYQFMGVRATSRSEKPGAN
jgi:hypothetical protein